ncbi:HTH-type transcriptional regulator MntR [subsurface metagenome]
MDGEVLSASLEDYLEAIYSIVQKKQAARAKDISRRLGVNSSSVTGALHSLSSKKLINYAPYDIITLTPEGEKAAKNVFHRHTVLQDFFIQVLGVDLESAEESACRMEHTVSKIILERLTQFVKFIKTCPRAGTRWIDGFGYFCENPESRENCERCIFRCLEKLRDERRR